MPVDDVGSEMLDGRKRGSLSDPPSGGAHDREWDIKNGIKGCSRNVPERIPLRVIQRTCHPTDHITVVEMWKQIYSM